MFSEQQSNATSNHATTETDPSQPVIYQIRLEGQLDHTWQDWFDGLLVTPEDNGNTLLTGPVTDQSALHGLLKKIRDLGMPLVSVNRLKPNPIHAENIKS